ncbi:hypothetical protein D7Y13_13840 [Corallococcus praedator]|uniref:DUF3592 domain-containing protein n=1 Tax=Corallococcus praedator TaxID=2316724 RepID=A0ABX9QJV8_9BACT|nr:MULTISPECIES: DUF3592 domain-containing protein [Corallococcus]RKI09778.1 hypothetical protein D7Y13_13840 [Corallococcus praedator]
MTPTVLVAVILGFVVVPLAMMVSRLRKRGLTQRLRQEGLRTQGDVLGITKDDEGPDVVHYAFFLPDGSRIESEGHSKASGQLCPGAPLDILYLPEDPRQNQPVDGGTGQVRFILEMIFLIGFMLTAAILFIKEELTPPESPQRPSPQRQLRPFEPQPPRAAPPSKGTPPLGSY